jgi:D-lactate dehydrogenase
MLINTSRGALINTTDIIEALKVVKLVIRDWCIRTREKLFFKDLSEDIIQDDTTINEFSNMLLTAHQAFFTNEALTQIALTTFRNIWSNH